MRNVISDKLLRCFDAMVAIGLVLSINIGATSTVSLTGNSKAVAKSARRSIASDDSEDRINALIRKMTLAEKIGQMQQVEQCGH